jgi:hypothetical protein
VLFSAPTYIETCSRVSFDRAEELIISGGNEEDGCLGSNQLLLKSKKQWSDQWQDEAKSMRRRNEQ